MTVLPHLIEDNYYTPGEVRLELERWITGKPIPERTFRNWKAQMGIVPSGPGGLYTASDIRDFAKVILNLQRGITMPQQIQIILEEQKNGDRSQSSEGEQTIDISAQTH